MEEAFFLDGAFSTQHESALVWIHFKHLGVLQNRNFCHMKTTITPSSMNQQFGVDAITHQTALQQGKSCGLVANGDHVSR